MISSSDKIKNIYIYLFLFLFFEMLILKLLFVSADICSVRESDRTNATKNYFILLVQVKYNIFIHMVLS